MLSEVFERSLTKRGIPHCTIETPSADYPEKERVKKSMLSAFLDQHTVKPTNAVWPDKNILIWRLNSANQVVSLNGEYMIEKINNGKVEVYKINTVNELKEYVTQFNIEV